MFSNRTTPKGTRETGFGIKNMKGSNNGGGRRPKPHVRRQFKLDSELDTKLRAYSRENDTNDTAVVEAALEQFFTTQQNQKMEKFKVTAIENAVKNGDTPEQFIVEATDMESALRMTANVCAEIEPATDADIKALEN